MERIPLSLAQIYFTPKIGCPKTFGSTLCSVSLFKMGDNNDEALEEVCICYLVNPELANSRSV